MNKKLNLFLCGILIFNANFTSIVFALVDPKSISSSDIDYIKNKYQNVFPAVKNLTLKNASSIVNQTDPAVDGQSLLELAAGLNEYQSKKGGKDLNNIVGDLKGVKILIGLGADPNIKDIRDTTPLMQASLAGQYDIVDYLLSHGADKSIINKHGRDAAGYATDQQKIYTSTSNPVVYKKLQDIIDLLEGNTQPSTDGQTGTDSGQKNKTKETSSKTDQPKNGDQKTPKKDDTSSNLSSSSASPSPDAIAGIVVAAILLVSPVLAYTLVKNKGGKLSLIEIEALSKMPRTNAQEVVDFVKSVQLLTGDKSETVGKFYDKIKNKALKDFVDPKDAKNLPKGAELSIQKIMVNNVPEAEDITKFSQELPKLMKETYIKNLTSQDKAKFLLDKLITEDFLISHSDKTLVIDFINSISQKSGLDFDDTFALFLDTSPIKNSPEKEAIISSWTDKVNQYKLIESQKIEGLATVPKTETMTPKEWEAFQPNITKVGPERPTSTLPKTGSLERPRASTGEFFRRNLPRSPSTIEPERPVLPVEIR